MNYTPEGLNLEQLQQQGLFRKERIVDSKDGTIINIGGKKLINFCSNDYLGLSSHPDVVRAMQDAAIEFGAGSTASPLVCGKTALHLSLEQKLAKVTGRERALILSCGYMANMAIVSSLARNKSQWIFQDKLCHASMVDGSMSSRATLKRYAHADPSALEKLLSQINEEESALVFTESVFSMDGDIAPLSNLSSVCQQYSACLVVDDAHGFGVIGKNGLGGTDYFSLGQNEVPLLMATFGKALGVYGAFIAGPEILIERFVQRARPYIYSTALPAPIIAAVSAAIDVMQREPEHRTKLASLINYFQSGANSLGIKISNTNTPIQPVILGDASRAVRLEHILEENGFLVRAIRPPTVPRNSSRLRITLSASHTTQQIDMLLDVLSLAMPALDISA